ncbi:hypothetical protein [Terriglobus roseus]|uniref:hypothetical protein n=1 Tax=Terriglobus roseus TaxID=392734 RepID=UPI001FCDA619|nr:hypothetical protein [Terriglobus roseus]
MISKAQKPHREPLIDSMQPVAGGDLVVDCQLVLEVVENECSDRRIALEELPHPLEGNAIARTSRHCHTPG